MKFLLVLLAMVVSVVFSHPIVLTDKTFADA